ncbi:LysR family transcriptional regulator [Vagococcus sp. BWB3-3]|uniref:LysR family transcriptional regulator n=1 Tax=Vagococcus allomyrinae TaxID=2794353 RepID=A0A940SRI6_9ENTE|nr:LysR family transcriptional regulator [Vagococcus allomyrinae]MBP1040857.1 LysR family transcriptional regulator [Vagococcus allomyrinae]
MELRLLRYFWTVAEEKNISKAAKLLAITQPTLSRQIKDLEEQVGLPLFIREFNHLELTEDGLFLKERAEEILALNDQLTLALSDKKNQQLKGSFSVGCVEADNSDTLALMLEELVSDHPQVHFKLVSGTSDDILEKLEKGLLDLAILLEPINTDAYECLPFPRDERWGLLVATNSLLGKKESIMAADLIGLPLLCSSRQEVQKLLAEWSGMPFETLNVVGTFNLIFNVFALVENQVGAALTVEGATVNHRFPEVTFVPLAPEVKTKCVLVWKRRLQTPVVKEVIARFKHAYQA